jgi:HlyD family secretion protein
VTAGTRLATLDPQPFQEALAAAEASVMLAQAELAKLRSGLRPQEITQAREAMNQALAVVREAQRSFERQSSLLASGASSPRAVDAARAERRHLPPRRPRGPEMPGDAPVALAQGPTARARRP